MEKNIFAQKMKCKAEKEKEGIFREDFFEEEKKTKEENIWSTLLLFVTLIFNPQLNDCTLTVGS